MPETYKIPTSCVLIDRLESRKHFTLLDVVPNIETLDTDSVAIKAKKTGVLAVLECIVCLANENEPNCLSV